MLLICILLLPSAAFAAREEEPVFPLVPGSSGDEVVLMQMRLEELGYINFRATGRFADMTYRGVIDFQKQNDLHPDGKVSQSVYRSFFENDVLRKPINPAFRRVSGPPLMATPTEFGKKGAWSEIDALFKTGEPIEITDFNTMKRFMILRVGGENHAHVVPASKKDYDTFLSCFGGEYTWEKRPALVTIGGTTYAASLFGMPNVAEPQAETDFMEGSLCLYFNGCTSHIAGIADSEHMLNIETAS